SGAGNAEAPEDHLRRITTVTEATLAHLDLEELLHILLIRIRDILEVDAATVLLLTEDERHLALTATTGITSSAFQKIQIPVGDSFVGKVATERTLLVSDRTDSSTMSTPLPWEENLRTQAGFPLLINN